jgi:putative endonuclease
MFHHNYYLYIVTNITRTVLYTGVTNDLSRRIQEHFENRGKPETFAGRYNCNILIHWERYPSITDAIDREKEIKKYSRARKEALIAKLNPNWESLDSE